MSFNEKLQYLRKENNLSQEALADMLDVTRQSVSKWESGTTYPEMDKLIMLCKIFKCSLDDLTNDEITEINSDKNSKAGSANFLNNILEIISKTVHMFKAMTFKQMTGCILSLFILALVLLLFRIPFELIENGLHSMLVPLITNIRAQKAIFGILCFILDMIYYALYILIYIYIYKIAFLDKYEFVNDKNNNIIKEEIKIHEKEKIISKPEQIIITKNKENSLFKLLSSLALAFIKFLLFIFSLPSIFILILFLFLLVIDIYLMFNGIFFIGVLLCLLSSIILVIWFLTLVSIFIFNRKIPFKKMLIIFLGSLIGFGISTGLIALEVSSFNFVSEVPSDLEKTKDHFEKEMNKDIYLNIEDYYADIKFIEDDTLKNISIDIEYYGKMYKFTLDEDEQVIGFKTYYSNEFDRMKYLFNSLKKNLKEKTFYNYDDMIYYNVTITTNKDNINIIKKNTEKVNHLYDSYDRRYAQYQDEINRLQEINEGLKAELDELEKNKSACIEQ